jgi:glycosyltransferase involved in cell wall biosynthesis
VDVNVVIPTHNPDRGRLDRALDALAAQTFPRDRWSIVLVDNASTREIEPRQRDYRIRTVRENRLGLTWARLRGVLEADAPLLVFVDDDNVLAPDYLAEACEIAVRYPTLGAFGGKSVAEWEDGHAPPGWVVEFQHNLAIRDLGETEMLVEASKTSGYPASAPIGAGMVVRKAALEGWTRSANLGMTAPDRSGATLTSGGDNEIVLHCLASGYDVGYFPRLALTHLMPPSRRRREYLGRLNYGVQRSWVAVLDRHAICPWRAAWPGSTLPRKARAYLRLAAWSGPAAWIRWRGACGHFDGRADIWRSHRATRLAS